MKGLSVIAAIIFTACSWSALAKNPSMDKSSDVSRLDSSSEDNRHADERDHDLDNDRDDSDHDDRDRDRDRDHDRDHDHDRDDHHHHRRSESHFMFTLGTTAVAGYTLGSTTATPLPGFPYVITHDLTLVPSVSPDGNAATTMALADDYLYIWGTCAGGSSFSGLLLAYSVSSSGPTLVSYGRAPPYPFDPYQVAMIPYAGNIYFVSSRDSANSPSTIDTFEPESYLDIDQASNGVLSPVDGLIPLDNCNAIAANIDASTAQLLVSCAPGTGTPTALMIPLATPTAAPTVITVPTTTSGTVGQSLLVDGYLYVLVNGTDAGGDGIAFFQSFSVSSSGAVTFIQQYSLGNFGPGAGVVSIAAGDGHLFYSNSSFQTLGGAGAVRISAGNMTASAVSAFIGAVPDGSIFFDVPSAMLLSNYQYRSFGTLVMPLGTPGIYYEVGAGSDTGMVGLAVVGN